MYFNMQSVSSYYGRTKILKDVSLEIEEGTCSCILGKNGVGKTTLVKTLMGLTTRSTGKIELSGRNLSDIYLSESSTHSLIASFVYLTL